MDKVAHALPRDIRIRSWRGSTRKRQGRSGVAASRTLRVSRSRPRPPQRVGARRDVVGRRPRLFQVLQCLFHACGRQDFAIGGSLRTKGLKVTGPVMPSRRYACAMLTSNRSVICAVDTWSVISSAPRPRTPPLSRPPAHPAAPESRHVRRPGLVVPWMAWT
jgi:hypothetical protein